MCIQCPLAGVTCQYEEIRLQECIKLYISANVDMKGEQLERVERDNPQPAPRHSNQGTQYRTKKQDFSSGFSEHFFLIDEDSNNNHQSP